MRNAARNLPLLAALAALAALAQPAPGGDGPARGEVVTLAAKVEAIDYANRVIALKGPLGRIVAIKVDDRVKNFGKVKAGDPVVVKYAQALAIADAAPGAPSAALARVVARVDAVDAARRVVLLEGGNARYVEVEVDDPALLARMKVGETVNATYTDALIVDIASREMP